MMTEDEAKTKWCPYKRGELYDGTRCIASACMAWRWNVVIGEYPNNTATPSKTHGFCGAFGETMLAEPRT
jgi:hypothetical protein